MPDRPVLIGKETGGSTGAPLVISLPHDFIARICTLRITYPYSDKPFANEGIKPDINVNPTIDDYINNEDTAKIEAIKYITNHIN